MTSLSCFHFPCLHVFQFLLFRRTKRFSFFFFFFLFSFQRISLLASVSQFNHRCFLRSRCSMEMWCRVHTGRDGWESVGPPTWERAWFNSPEWSGGSSPVETEPLQIVLLLLLVLLMLLSSSLLLFLTLTEVTVCVHKSLRINCATVCRVTYKKNSRRLRQPPKPRQLTAVSHRGSKKPLCDNALTANK